MLKDEEFGKLLHEKTIIGAFPVQAQKVVLTIALSLGIILSPITILYLKIKEVYEHFKKDS
jgi:hypothetical protein